MLEPGLTCFGRSEGPRYHQSLRPRGTERADFFTGILSVLGMNPHFSDGKIYLSDSSENMLVAANSGLIIHIKMV